MRKEFPQSSEGPVLWNCSSQTLEQPDDEICGLVGKAVCGRIGERLERFGTVRLRAFGPMVDPSAHPRS